MSRLSPTLALLTSMTEGRGATRSHRGAFEAPVGFERPIVGILRCLAEYAECHAVRYGSPIGDDGVLGSDWEVMARALIGLLNGDTGRLDCGTVDRSVRLMAQAAGVNLED